MPFNWSINPYRGCRHACVYCYARPTHEYLGQNASEEFQEVIFAKVNGPEVVRKELGKRSWGREPVVVGTATDPYQQAESRYRLTGRILDAFRDFRNPVSITTKSPMVLRDIDVLAELAQRAEVTVHFTVTTMDEALWKAIEPTTAKPHKRLEAMQMLRERGIRSGVFLSPVLPGLTDDERHLEEVVRGASDHGAQFLYSNVLRLGPGISDYYLPFLEQNFPELRPRYARFYTRNSAPPAYADEIAAKVDKLRKRYRIIDEPKLKLYRREPMPLQLTLFN
jgi:DNA repair photolyase